MVENRQRVADERGEPADDVDCGVIGDDSIGIDVETICLTSVLADEIADQLTS